MRVEYEIKSGDYFYRDDGGDKVKLWYGAHLHYHIELVYMLDGEVDAYVDSELYRIKKGDFLIIFPNKVHRFEKVTEHHSYKLFIINPDICAELSEKFLDFTPENPVICGVDSDRRLSSIIDSLSSLSPDEEYYKLNLQGLTTSLFCECIKRLNLIGGRVDESHAVRVVVDFCSKNFKRELSLSLLENELHLSKYYISHIFSGKLGVSFNDYVNSLRISYACRKLISTDMSVTKIGEIAGFSTLRTFNRAFYKQMNVSPSEYRKNYLRSNSIASLPV